MAFLENGSPDASLVLIVDDEVGVLGSMTHLLSAEGYRVLSATEAGAGLALLKTYPIDAVISDIILPGVTGTDFLSEVKRIAPDIEVIMMTGEPDTESALTSLRHHAFDYLPKPMDPDRLLRVLENAVRLRRTREENRVLHARLENRARELEEIVRDRTAELARLSGVLLGIQDAERARLSGEVHDSIGQALLLLRMQLQYLKKDYEQVSVELGGELDRILELLIETIESCRRVARAMSPPELQELGLFDAIVQLSRTLKPAGIEIECDVNGTASLDGARALHAYRIVQECLTNGIKHSGGDRIRVLLRGANGTLVLSVQDNGRGIQPRESGAGTGIGMAIMRQRAALAGGHLKVRSGFGIGTEVCLTLSIARDGEVT